MSTIIRVPLRIQCGIAIIACLLDEPRGLPSPAVTMTDDTIAVAAARVAILCAMIGDTAPGPDSVFAVGDHSGLTLEASAKLVARLPKPVTCSVRGGEQWRVDCTPLVTERQQNAHFAIASALLRQDASAGSAVGASTRESGGTVLLLFPHRVESVSGAAVERWIMDYEMPEITIGSRPRTLVEREGGVAAVLVLDSIQKHGGASP